MKRELKITSLRIEKYISKLEDNIFIENERYIFNCTSQEELWELMLYTEFKKNSKGQIISYGNMEIKKVKRFSGINYFLKEKLVLKINNTEENIENKAFSYTKKEIVNKEGENLAKNIIINWEQFKETVRNKKKRPVWIITGDSCLGKTYLSSMIDNYSHLKVYETDINQDLPEVFIEDIIVIGKKYKFDIQDVMNRIFGEVECIQINFEKIK